MHFFGYIFPFFFAGMWVLVNYLLSKMGWADLVAHYQTTPSFSGHRLGVISASINGVNYNTSLILRYNDEGMYLKTIWIFRLFHQPVFIPWKDIKEIRDKKIIFFHVKELIIGHPFVAKMTMKKSTFGLIENVIPTSYLKGKSL